MTEAELTFHIQKSNLRIRPIWHQNAEWVLAYVLLKTLANTYRRSSIGDEPRRVFDELEEIRLVDVIVPTSEGIEILRRCVSRPSKHQFILLDRLGLELPQNLDDTEM